MKVPKKITPDRIRESIVQVFFKTGIPLEPLVGYLYDVLTGLGFSYTNSPIKQQSSSLGITPQPNEMVVNLIPQYLFFNEKIKIQLHPNNSLVFNCINNYIGWGEYFKIIKQTLNALKKGELFHSYSRIGIRYISEFPNIDISDKINFSYKLNVLNKAIDSGNFRMEWGDSSNKITMNLGVKLPIMVSTTLEETKINYISLIDIDVINQGFNFNTNKELFLLINETHTKQKQLFFKMLTKEFLKTLNPVY